MSQLVKTPELLGAALDWAVAKCEGKEWNLVESFLDYYDEGRMHYSDDWAQGGPIIEREMIGLGRARKAPWLAYISPPEEHTKLVYGSTPLITAMRCYVVSKLGNEVEIPQELA